MTTWRQCWKRPYTILNVKESDIHDIASTGLYKNTRLNGRVEETHISWVILTRKFAFKIKKPLKLGFLDFSTPALRRELCEKELKLNQRFSDIYLDVLPVRSFGKQWIIGGEEDAGVVDHCVVMKRMATSQRLDNVLRDRAVTEKAIRVLAAEIAWFHNKAERVFSPFEIGKARGMFNDIASIGEFASDHLGAQFGQIIKHAIEWSDIFLTDHRLRIQQRIDHGLKRDVHGDLHSGNIFLYRRPVLFDCLEFNDDYRQIDVLYEIAFLCMDLERFGQEHLAEAFLDEYKGHFPAFQQKEDHRLFVYFKSLRANIRAKVHALQWRQADNPSGSSYHLAETSKYLVLMNKYIASMDLHFL